MLSEDVARGRDRDLRPWQVCMPGFGDHCDRAGRYVQGHDGVVSEAVGCAAVSVMTEHEQVGGCAYARNGFGE